MTILLVRHARAGSRGRWKGDDRLRPLSKKGRVQARALPQMLAPWTSGRHPLVLSSAWVRCIETVGPLAAACGTPVEEDGVLGEGMGVKAVEAMGRWLARRPVVACTHGDVIEEILDAIVDSGVDLGRDGTAQKGSVWVLDGVDRTICTAHYLEPPA